MFRSLLFTIALVTAGFTGPQAIAQGPGPTEIVTSWYRHFLGREPDVPGLQGWVYQIGTNGVPYDDALASFLGSEEYYQRQGSRDSSFIIALYRDLLGRYPNSVELQIMNDQLHGSGTRAAFARNFLTATQFDRANRVMAPPPRREEWRYRRAIPPPIPPEER